MKSPNCRSVVMRDTLWERVCREAARRNMSAGAFIRTALTAALEQVTP